MQQVYLDNHTTTKPSAAVAKGMVPFLSEHWGAATAPHSIGQEVLPYLAKGYISLYKLLGASDRDTVILTSSGAEAVNHLVLSTYLDVTRNTGKNHFITSQVDEAPVIMAMGRLEQLGCVVKMAEVDKGGRVTAKAISEAISPRTALVSLSWANGMTGVIHEVAEIAKVCQSRGILFHLDATHVIGKIFFDISQIRPDFITFNGDHLHGPKGTGVLYIRAGVKVSPFILGGQDQGGQRAGAVNTPGLIGLSIAADEAMEHQDLVCTETARLRDRLEEGIAAGCSDAVIFYKDEERLPNCTAIAFPGVSNDTLLYILNSKGVFASFGGGNFQKISLLVEASGVDEMLANCTLHFSLSRQTTEEEIDRALSIIVEAVKDLKKVSADMGIS